MLVLVGCSKKTEEPPPKIRPNVASITDIRVELIKRPEVKVAFTLRDPQGKAMTVHDANIKIAFSQDKVRSDQTQHIDESIAITDKAGPRYELTYRMPDKENCIKPFRDLPVSAELSSYDFDGKGASSCRAFERSRDPACDLDQRRRARSRWQHAAIIRRHSTSSLATSADSAS